MRTQLLINYHCHKETPMENHHFHPQPHHHHRHQKTNSRDTFSFPSTPSTQDQDSDFEFGCLTPDYPSTDPFKNSPADHLFFNGRLLPHSFPRQPEQSNNLVLIYEHNTMSRTTSRTSSVSSKDSFMSSRSNSTNGSRSSVSSARTSSSESSSSSERERRPLYHNNNAKAIANKAPLASKVVMAQLYGSSQRWQHIVPLTSAVLKREDSRRQSNNNGGILAKGGLILSRKKQGGGGDQEGKKKKLGFLQRFFKSFLVACKQCHAMELPVEDDMLQENIKS